MTREFHQRIAGIVLYTLSVLTFAFFVGTDIVDGPGLCSLMDSWPNYQLTQVGPTQAHLTMGDFFFFF